MNAQHLISILAVLTGVHALPHDHKPRPGPPAPPGGPPNGPDEPDQCHTFDYDALSLREIGARNTLVIWPDWRVYLELHGQPISFWHDVPLYPDPSNDRIINAVVEIPRWVDSKIEIRRPEPLNPIFHDDKKDLPRFVQSVFPHKSYPFIYGSIPQTWESQNFDHSFVSAPGDNDPMDFFDIGQDTGYTGQVKQVKILGCLAPNDGGETDWKQLVIDLNDPIAPYVNDFTDVEKYRPGQLQAFRDWFTYYKVARGDGLIELVGESYQNASFCASMVRESHQYWADLVSGQVDSGKINYNQTSQPDLESYVECKEATKMFDLPKNSDPKPAAAKPKEYDQWYFLDENFGLVAQP